MASVITQGYGQSGSAAILQGYLAAIIPPPPPTPVVSGSGADGSGGSGGRKKSYRIEKPRIERKYVPRNIRVVETKDRELQRESVADRIRQEQDDEDAAGALIMAMVRHWADS